MQRILVNQRQILPQKNNFKLTALVVDRKVGFILTAFAMIDGYFQPKHVIVAIGLAIKYVKCRRAQGKGIFVIGQSLILVSVSFARKLTKWLNLGHVLFVSMYIALSLLIQCLLPATKFGKHNQIILPTKFQVQIFCLTFVKSNEAKRHLKPSTITTLKKAL